MKLDSSIQKDLLKLGAMLGSFTKHINDPALKAHITMQSQMAPQQKALKPDGVNSGITAKEIYGEPATDLVSFNDHLKRNGPIFVSNEVGAFAKTHDAMQSVELLNSKLSSMTLEQQEQFRRFVEQVGANSISNKTPENFQQTRELHSIFDQHTNQTQQSVLKR